jgi:hypothetical protein
MKLIDIITEMKFKNTEERKIAHKFLEHHGFVKVKTNLETEWFSNQDETYNLTVRIYEFYFGQSDSLMAKIVYRGPKKDSPDEIVEMNIPEHGYGVLIHHNNYGFPYDLDYALRYVKSIKDNKKMEPVSDKPERLWDLISTGILSLVPNQFK